MKKLVTATTLTAGIGAAIAGLDHGHEAHAAETANTQQSTQSSNTQNASGNLYTAGQCTWYVTVLSQQVKLVLIITFT